MRDRTCRDKLAKGKGAKQEDPGKACSATACRQIGEHNRVDFPNNKQQQLEQQKQKPLQEGQLRSADLSSEQKLEQRGENKRRGTKACITRSAAYPSQPQGEPNQLLRRRWCRRAAPQTTSLETTKQDAATDCSSFNQLQTTACNKNSLGIGAQERPPKRPWRILVDTGAELSVAPRSFAEHIQLSPLEQDDLQLRTATGMAIETFGIRTVQLLCQGFSFTMNFVIADVEQPLLGLGSLLRESLSLHLDSNLGRHLGNKAGDKIQLEQRGQQIYLVACPAELGLNPCMIGSLLDHSLVPEAKILEPEISLDEGGAKATSFSLESFEQQKQHKNKPAIGQQTALPKAAKKQKQKGQQKAASKLRTLQQTRFIEKMQLALLEPEDPGSSLDAQASKDLSLRILLTLSLMKKWQLTTTRIRTASPPQLTKSQLRELGLRQSVVDNQIFVGIQLCVMLHERTC